MRKKLAAMVALAVGVLALSAAAAEGTRTATLEFTSVLSAGQEVPHPAGAKAGASGKFSAKVTGKKITWTLTFTHLTGPATAAHIHMGKKGVPGAVVVPLCGPCKSPASGTGTLSSALLAKMKSGGTYVNVHTTKNAGGEIRGQIRQGM